MVCLDFLSKELAMVRTRQLAWGVVLLSSMFPSVSVHADGPAPKSNDEAFGRDVILSESTLLGRYVSASGAGIKDMRASIRQAGKEVASGFTDAQGNFRVSGLQTGVYEVIIGCRSEFIRVWDHDLAPPKAHPRAQIVRDGHLQGNGGTGGALRLMGAGGNAMGLLESLMGNSPAIKESPVAVPKVP